MRSAGWGKGGRGKGGGGAHQLEVDPQLHALHIHAVHLKRATAGEAALGVRSKQLQGSPRVRVFVPLSLGGGVTCRGAPCGRWLLLEEGGLGLAGRKEENGRDDARV